MTIAWNTSYAIGYHVIDVQKYYPEARMNRGDHQHFIGKLQGCPQHLQQEGNTLDLLVDTTEALILWLFRHIRTVDVALGTFLHSRQV